MQMYKAQKEKEILIPLVVADLNGQSREKALKEVEIDKETFQRKTKKLGIQKHIQAATRRVTKEILQDKIPILKEIAELSLVAVRDKLLELSDPEKNAEMLKTMRDIKDLSNIAQGLNEMLRLELGQSTQNVAVNAQMSLEQTITIFKELANKDRVFEYPLLDEGNEKESKPDSDGSS